MAMPTSVSKPPHCDSCHSTHTLPPSRGRSASRDPHVWVAKIHDLPHPPRNLTLGHPVKSLSHFKD